MKRLLNEILPEYSAQQISNASYKFSFRFILTLLWLFSSTFLIYFLEIENSKGFREVAIILSAAFLVYIFVPLKYRKLFLVALAFGVEVYLVGALLAVGIFVLILFFTLLTYVKNKNVRTVLIIVSIILCVLIFSKIIVVPFVRNVLLFGALFLMLRYIYLLYELSYFKRSPLFIERLGYLFLIPNACFPLFPALDPKEYLNAFYNVSFLVSLNRALHNITIGIIHTLIYRIIYFYFSPSSYEIEGFWTWLNFILSSYSLIFRLSGLFYLAVGFLELFGFKFRPVFDHVYFATGFVDLWRRVNLNWREFMMRVFYYPFMFRFKKYNPVIVLFFCINIMFFVSWFLHSWQWFWIKGSGYFYLTDILFWMIFGIIVSIQSVRAYLKFNRTPDTKQDNYFVDSVKLVLMLFVMCVLWSMWTSSSLTEFIYIGTFAKTGTVTDYLLFVSGIAGLILLVWLIRYLYFEKKWFSFVFSELKPISGIVLCLIVFCFLKEWSLVNAGSYKEEVSNFLSMNVNQKDRNSLERGYYDQILNDEDKSIELLNFGGKFTKWNIDNKAYVRTKNELIKEFIPNFKTTFKGDTLSTNGLGLRDKEYNLVKDSGVVRMAFLGGSYLMGSGVSNEENFASLLENELNDSLNNRVEILNFGAGGYHLIQSVFITDNKLEKFKADYAFYFMHSANRTRCLDDLVNLVQKDNLTYPFLNEIVNKAQLTKSMCRLEIYNKLKPFINDVINWGYERIYKECMENNIIPIIVYLPTNAGLREDPDKEYCFSLVLKTGFHIVDLSDVYNGQIPKDIQLSGWDTHPNERGHKLISDLLFENLKKDKEFFKFMKSK